MNCVYLFPVFLIIHIFSRLVRCFIYGLVRGRTLSENLSLQHVYTNLRMCRTYVSFSFHIVSFSSSLSSSPFYYFLTFFISPPPLIFYSSFFTVLFFFHQSPVVCLLIAQPSSPFSLRPLPVCSAPGVAAARVVMVMAGNTAGS